MSRSDTFQAILAAYVDGDDDEAAELIARLTEGQRADLILTCENLAELVQAAEGAGTS